MEPEIRARTRRRRSEPAPPPPPATPLVRSWLIYGGITTVVGALALDGFLSHRPERALLPVRSQTREVRSTIAESADSLQVVVSWDLTLSDADGRPDSIRIKVVEDKQRDSLVSIQPADQFADTVYLPGPAPGQSLTGISCAAAEHPGELGEETCTPWQYVMPTITAEAGGAAPTQIVIQPSGLQVDPDVDGACARWQEDNPNTSVWVVVNSQAVPECTGPNRRPTVAQFCAFAVLPDGRRVKTENSANNPYCDELFEEWIQERFT